MPVVNPHAAGIDIGADEMYVSVPTDSSPTPIAKFGAFTPDLLELVRWLEECGIRTVAMESTGVLWIPLFELLEERGFSVTLVSPNYPKKDRKTDVEDCQWLQYLHSVGLLRGSFRPPEAICAIREVLRYRSGLVSQAGSDILRMQKSLTQMNLLLHNVISDITGVTGLAIIDDILAGERDPKALAQRRNHRIKASCEEIEKSLTGHYRREHVFTLGQSRKSYRIHLEQIAECDAEIERMLKEIDGEPPIAPPGDTGRSRFGKNDVVLPNANLRDELSRIFGVDLMRVPGLGANTACAILAEVGRDLAEFPSPAAFASWLKLCCDPRISGGKAIGPAVRRPKPKLGSALRIAAQSLERSETYLGCYFRRMKARFGAPVAVKATAHKLALIIFAMITKKEPYDEGKFDQAAEKIAQRKLRRLQKDAAALGLTITPA
jgi:transposase